MGGAARAQYHRFRRRRAQPAVPYRHRYRLRHLVRLGDGAGHPRRVPEGRPVGRGVGPVRVVAVPDPGGPVLCPAAVPDEPADHRRLLPQPLWPAGRGADHAVHRSLLPGLGRGADQGAGAGVLYRVGRRAVAGGRHDDRRRQRAGLYAVRRHVVGGDHRLHPDDHHRDRHDVYRLRGQRPGRRRDRGGLARGRGRQVRVPAVTRFRADHRLCRGAVHHDAGLDPAAGRVPAGDLVAHRADRRTRVGAGRRAVLRLRLYPDVPGVLGHADRSGHGGQIHRHRLAADPAAADPAARADVRPGDVLRRAAVGDQELRLGDAAGAVGDLCREHPAPVLPPSRRQAVPARDAGGGAGVHHAGDAVRAEFAPVDFPYGRKCLQGHAGVVVRAAGLRHVLEARHPPGRAGGHPAGVVVLADLRDRLCRCRGAAADGGPAVLGQRHGDRFPAAAVDCRSRAGQGSPYRLTARGMPPPYFRRSGSPGTVYNSRLCIAARDIPAPPPWLGAMPVLVPIPKFSREITPCRSMPTVATPAATGAMCCRK
ncbi:hypothetical protein CBM2609_A50135 [Cupriavidus taiwanensis]|nr:hypothetical protein CBM2604_A40136 [Cupriavidus taiwanensis]SOZ27202.1 hypothetical protein CBM2609_A50135 [Cupriavidus taiwanensis]